MFKFENNYNDAIVLYENSKGESVDFVVEALINRRLRDTIYPDKIFVLLNKYLEWKGNEFRDQLFDVLVDVKNTILIQTTRQELEPYPYEIVHKILDMFDYEEVRNWVEQSNAIYPPKSLPDDFDDTIVMDEKGSREQTYLKSDYYDLVALITILKATFPAIGEYASVKENSFINETYREYILLTFYTTHNIFQTPPFQKIYQSVEKLIERLFNDEQNTAIRIIEKTISKDSLPYYITALVIFQKLMTNNEIDDTDTRNTITKIYSFASNKLKLKDGTSNIKIKHFSNSEDENVENESVLESFRVPSAITQGSIEEFKWVFSDPIRLAKQLKLNASDEVILDTVAKFGVFYNILPIEENIVLASWVYKDIIDARAFQYLEIDEIIVALALAFLWLWENNHKELACILSSYSTKLDVIKINFSLRNKIDNEIREKLKEIFPYEKPSYLGGEYSTNSYVEESISLVSKNIMGYNLVSILDDQYLEEVYGTKNKNIKVTENIKNLIGLYIIDIYNKF